MTWVYIKWRRPYIEIKLLNYFDLLKDILRSQSYSSVAMNLTLFPWECCLLRLKKECRLFQTLRDKTKGALRPQCLGIVIRLLTRQSMKREVCVSHRGDKLLGKAKYAKGSLDKRSIDS